MLSPTVTQIPVSTPLAARRRALIHAAGSETRILPIVRDRFYAIGPKGTLWCYPDGHGAYIAGRA